MELPIAVQGCSLDAAQLVAQAERYSKAGTGATLRARDERRLVIQLSEAIAETLVAELLDVERRCCPFFELEWQPEARRLTVAVGRPEDEAALSAVGRALGLGDS
jgi:hypothetical protein